MSVSRRQFVRSGSLWVAGAMLAGCRREHVQAPDASEVAPVVTSPPPPPLGASCTLTPDNIEGPYYRAGAPFRSDLADAGMPGTRLVIRGRLTDPSCRPLGGALLDVWQADKDGRYDNDGHAGDRLVLRGKLSTHADGSFEVRSVIPGHYLNGKQWRPAHVHVKVSAAGFAPLTTQLYFEGDPYNDIDPFIKAPLIMKLADEGTAKAARFDLTLQPV